ncbi:acyl-CoA carboxylase subunit epsilon [Streptomyces sp. NPDC086549]|uniref:acyl-CoA carboxylase subunit epsilon n=1 Tax=Streptomyces sp. NPDC086549 TaxID=3365752 RepID=UPI0037FC66AB
MSGTDGIDGIRVLSGEPTPEELAALLVVLRSLTRRRVGGLPADIVRPAAWAHAGRTHRPAGIWRRTA